eukprot:3539109-Amphidinium_carterae.1
MGGRSQGRASSRAVAREDKLKHKQERKDRRNASTSPPRTVIASPGSHLPVAVSDVVPGASPKTQPKSNISPGVRMDVDDVDSVAKHVRANESQSRCLSEQHSQDMRQHGQELAALRKHVAKLEESQGQPAHGDIP